MLSKPVDYLTEETYRPYWLKDGVTETTINSVAQKKTKLIDLGKELSHADRYYMVGSGGSYSVHLPLIYISEKHTKATVNPFSGWAFLERQPKGVDEKAAVILISQSGKTKEIIEAVDYCNSKGAVTFGLTQKHDSLINEKTDISHGWGAPGVTFGKLMSMYYLFGSIFQEKGYKIGAKIINEADKLPKLLPPMIPKAKENAKKQGLILKDYEKIYVVGGGINWGLTYQFAICTLMEMCWVHGIPISFSEFRHGPLEMFTPNIAAIFLRSRSAQRILEKRIIDFSEGNGVTKIVFDSQGLDVDNLLTPFTLFIELEWMSYYLSLAKNRRMGTWRFYDKVRF